MEKPCGKSFIRGAAAALVSPVAASAVALLRSGTAFTSILLGLAHRKRARFGNAQAIIRCGEPVQLQPVQLQLWVRIAPKSPLLGRAIGVLLCDDGLVPLICPTCQVFAQSASVPATTMLLCMGLFSIF